MKKWSGPVWSKSTTSSIYKSILIVHEQSVHWMCFIQRTFRMTGSVMHVKKLVTQICIFYQKWFLVCFLEEKQVTDNYSDEDSNSSCNTSEDDNESESNQEEEMTDRRYWFDCLHDGCTARYRYYSHLLHHYTLGKRKMKLEKHSLVDKSKILFHENLTINHGTRWKSP